MLRRAYSDGRMADSRIRRDTRGEVVPTPEGPSSFKTIFYDDDGTKLGGSSADTAAGGEVFLTEILMADCSARVEVDRQQDQVGTAAHR